MVEFGKELSKNMDNTLKQIRAHSKDIQKSNDDDIFQEVGLDLHHMESLATKTADSFVTQIEIKFVNKSELEDPFYQHPEDSGFDFRANIEDDMVIGSLQRILVPTGLYFEIHDEYELQVRPRSGLAIKHGITVLNTPGTVDSNYRGEIKIILVNLSNEKYTVKRGDRIAQGVISYVLKTKWAKLKRVSKLSYSTRGDGGFGSTGKS
jgi:dUTP pyrophosphatase